MDRDCAFAVVELIHEVGRDKRVDDTRLFRDRDAAMDYLRRRYRDVVGNKNSLCGLMADEFSEDGWFDIVDNDGERCEAYLSERIEIVR